MVKVNNASVSEMKHACDDALKRVSAASLRVICAYFAGRVRMKQLSVDTAHQGCFDRGRP